MADETDGLRRLFKIRALTAFVSAAPRADELVAWAAELAAAAAFLAAARAHFERAGFAVQTTRVATRALDAAPTLAEAVALGAALDAAAAAAGVEFLNLGATSQRAFLAPGAVASLAGTLTRSSFTVLWDGAWGPEEARALAAGIFAAAAAPDPAATFRFGVAFGVAPHCPFFPAARAGVGSAAPRLGFALGCENSALLNEAFRRAAAAAGGAPAAPAAVAAEITACFGAALAPLEAAALELAESTCVEFYGTDTSVAPALEPPGVPDAFELAGLGPFGGGGTLALAAAVTTGLRAFPCRRVGYCGLMLPVAEDAALAAAAAEGRVTLQTLLTLSSVCGVGLDVVPLPGPAANAAPAEREALERRAAAALLDVAALSSKLGGKPLTVRLLPVLGGKAGDAAVFDGNPHLVKNARVMAW
jgi:uncharacterized protein (UPF0210 family)